MCALAGLLAFVGLEALLGLNRRLPVIVEPTKEDPRAKSDPPLGSTLNATPSLGRSPDDTCVSVIDGQPVQLR